jgi:hypothetical protein
MPSHGGGFSAEAVRADTAASGQFDSHKQPVTLSPSGTEVAVSHQVKKLHLLPSAEFVRHQIQVLTILD